VLCQIRNADPDGEGGRTTGEFGPQQEKRNWSAVGACLTWGREETFKAEQGGTERGWKKKKTQEYKGKNVKQTRQTSFPLPVIGKTTIDEWGHENARKTPGGRGAGSNGWGLPETTKIQTENWCRGSDGGRWQKPKAREKSKK